MMNITAKQLVSAPKKIGLFRGESVMALATKGGLHMIVAPKGSGFETLGTGPHPAVARFIADKNHAGITWTGLNKADHIEPEHFATVLPKYEALTERCRHLQAVGGNPREE